MVACSAHTENKSLLKLHPKISEKTRPNSVGIWACGCLLSPIYHGPGLAMMNTLKAVTVFGLAIASVVAMPTVIKSAASTFATTLKATTGATTEAPAALHMRGQASSAKADAMSSNLTTGRNPFPKSSKPNGEGLRAAIGVHK